MWNYSSSLNKHAGTFINFWEKLQPAHSYYLPLEREITLRWAGNYNSGHFPPSGRRRRQGPRRRCSAHAAPPPGFLPAPAAAQTERTPFLKFCFLPDWLDLTKRFWEDNPIRQRFCPLLAIFDQNEMGCRHFWNLSFENYLTDQDGSNTKKLSDFKGYTDMQSDSWKIVPKKSTTGSKLVDTSL